MSQQIFLLLNIMAEGFQPFQFKTHCFFVFFILFYLIVNLEESSCGIVVYEFTFYTSQVFFVPTTRYPLLLFAKTKIEISSVNPLKHYKKLQQCFFKMVLHIIQLSFSGVLLFFMKDGQRERTEGYAYNDIVLAPKLILCHWAR